MRGQGRKPLSKEILDMLENERWDQRLRIQQHEAAGEKINWDFAMGFDAAFELIEVMIRDILWKHHS